MMKRRMTFWMIGMLLSLLPSVAFASDGLTFKNVSLGSKAYANVPMVILIEVTNTAAEDYYGWWSVNERVTWDNFQAIEIKAGETRVFAFEVFFYKTGDVQLSVFDLITEKALYTFPVPVETIEPKVEGTIDVNLQQDDEGHYFIYSDFSSIDIWGIVTFTNKGESILFNKPKDVVGAYDTFFQIALVPQIEGEDCSSNVPGLADEIQIGETFSGLFTFDLSAKPIEGQEYTVQLKYLNNVVATSKPFTFRYGTNTYWSADGSQKPLPIVDDVLKVPADALAVDMRGLYLINTVFSIDVSEASPNCLYYLGFLDYVPKGFDSETNIIRNGEASTLVIDSNYDYYCPVHFRAKSALFIYTPISETMGNASPIMSQKMSAAIRLPFFTAQAWLVGTNELHPESPFYNEDFKIAKLDRKDETSLIFKPVVGASQLLGYYDYYLIYDMKPSPIAFYTEDIGIPTRFFSQDLFNTFFFEGYHVTTQNIYANMAFEESWLTRPAKKNTYRWSCDQNCFVRNEEGDEIRPFTFTIGQWDEKEKAFIDMEVDTIEPNIEMPDIDPTAIMSTPQTPTNTSLTVFSLSGQPVGTATYTNGQLKAEGLKPGLYVAGGKKIVIK